MKRLVLLSTALLFASLCTAQEPVTLGLDSDEGLTIDVPEEYTRATYTFGSLPLRNREPTQGLTVTLNADEGIIFYGPAIETGPGEVLVECSVWCTGPDVGLALVATNLPDYSMMANLPANGEKYRDGWHTIRLLYNPDDDRLMPAFQVVSRGPSTTTVYVDEIRITPTQNLDLDRAMELLGISAQPTPRPTIVTGHTILGTVFAFPSGSGVMRGVQVTLNPLGWTDTTNPTSGSFRFENVPDGEYTLTVSPECNPFACWPVKTVVVSGSHLPVSLYPVEIEPPPTPTPPTPTPSPTPTPTLLNPPEITVDFLDMGNSARPLEMVLIPAGTFTMGSPIDERGRYADQEWPPHEVTITKPFYMSKYEVTQRQLETMRVHNSAHSYGRGANFPAYRVSWDSCQEFIKQLNKRSPIPFRLPTEAEWEYACRAGTNTRFSFGDALECFDSEDASCPVADPYMWWRGNKVNSGVEYGSRLVGGKLPSPWGLYDMHGNVTEWCSDVWEAPYNRGPRVDPQGPASGTYRVTRGGDWNGIAQICRSAYRSGAPAVSVDPRGTGIRLVRECIDPVPPTPTPVRIPCEGDECITIEIPGLPSDAIPLEMVLIKPGTFTMGSPEDEGGRTTRSDQELE